MRFRISHTTHYQYSDEVFLEPHFLRFKPRVSAYLAIEEFNIRVEPDPSGFSEQNDTENNHTRLYWFDNLHRDLTFTVDSVVQLFEYDPFNFLVYPTAFLELPFQYDSNSSAILGSSLKSNSVTGNMQEYLEVIRERANRHTLRFLVELTRQVHDDFIVESRELGPPLDASQTFQLKKGSCRDLAWMQIQMLRFLGIASRFVSGYFYLQGDQSELELHAWTEVYLPGAGWIGFDPSHGIAAGTYHIPLASSAFHENTMPVTGSIRGNAESSMDNFVKISRLPGG